MTAARTGREAPKQRTAALSGVLEPVGTTDAPVPVVEPQTLILDGFPSPYMVARLGPNSGTTNKYGLGRLRKDVQGFVKVAVTRQGILPVPPPARLILRYVFPDARHRDADNFAVIGKPVVDGLVKSEILEGDNAARLTLTVEFVKRPGQRRLEVVLEPVDQNGHSASISAASPSSGGRAERVDQDQQPSGG